MTSSTKIQFVRMSACVRSAAEMCHYPSHLSLPRAECATTPRTTTTILQLYHPTTYYNCTVQSTIAPCTMHHALCTAASLTSAPRCTSGSTSQTPLSNCCASRECCGYPRSLAAWKMTQAPAQIGPHVSIKTNTVADRIERQCGQELSGKYPTISSPEHILLTIYILYAQYWVGGGRGREVELSV